MNQASKTRRPSASMRQKQRAFTRKIRQQEDAARQDAARMEQFPMAYGVAVMACLVVQGWFGSSYSGALAAAFTAVAVPALILHGGRVLRALGARLRERHTPEAS